MRVTLNCPDYYDVKMDEIAISQMRLKTAGLFTCVGLAMTQGNQKLLSHVTATSSVEEISNAIKHSFDTSLPVKVSLINGDLEAPDTRHATKICIDALRAAGVQSPHDYVAPNGGFLATVNLLHDHMIYFEDPTRIPQKLIRFNGPKL